MLLFDTNLFFIMSNDQIGKIEQMANETIV